LNQLSILYPRLDLKRIPLKRTILSLLFGSLIITSCSKSGLPPAEDPCLPQNEDPSGRSYSESNMVAVTYLQKNCGFMPLSRNSYWVYEDSFFNAGQFLKVQLDTLRFSQTYQTTSDNLIWWKANLDIGLPEMMYANDSALFAAEFRLFSSDPVRDAKKAYGLFEGDSIKYLTQFQDNAAFGRSVKLTEKVSTDAGSFSDCILFEKKAPFYRKDQMIFKPGIGVIRFISEEAPMGTPVLKLKQVSTLVSYHLD
jgi:hypothetical protein